MRYGFYLPNFGYCGDARLAHEAEAAGWDGFFLWRTRIAKGPPDVGAGATARSDGASPGTRFTLPPMR